MRVVARRDFKLFAFLLEDESRLRTQSIRATLEPRSLRTLQAREPASVRGLELFAVLRVVPRRRGRAALLAAPPDVARKRSPRATKVEELETGSSVSPGIGLFIKIERERATR